MKCRCSKIPSVKFSYTEREYCDKCFMHYLEQRVRKDIRMNKDIEPLDTLHLLDDGSKEFLAARHFLKSIFGKNITIVPTKEKKGKFVIPTNLDRSISENLRDFLEKTDKEPKGIPILDNVLEEEVVEACRILGKEYETTEEVNFLIEKMEEKYPDTKFSLHRAFQKLERRSS